MSHYPKALHRHIQSTRALLLLGRPEAAKDQIRVVDLHQTFPMQKFPDMYTQMANCYAANISVKDDQNK